MEIKDIIDKQIIYNLLDKQYDKIIFINNMLNIDLFDDKFLELFKDAIKLNHYCKEIKIKKNINIRRYSIYEIYKDHSNFIKYIMYLLLKCKNITEFTVNNISLYDISGKNFFMHKLLNVLNKSSLKKITLKHDNLDNINPFFETLKENKTLEFLNLSFNRITDISNLDDLLQYNNTLKCINLSYNNISNLEMVDNIMKKYPNVKIII